MDEVTRFYGGDGGLVAALREALDDARSGDTPLRTVDLAPVDEFHIRGRSATMEIAEALRLTPDSHVLDLGSGLGGPARTLAELTGCTVTGIDLTRRSAKRRRPCRSGQACRIGPRSVSAMPRPRAWRMPRWTPCSRCTRR